MILTHYRLKIHDHGLWFWEDSTPEDITRTMADEWDLLPCNDTIQVRHNRKICTIPHKDSRAFVYWYMGKGTLYVSYGGTWWYKPITRQEYDYYSAMGVYGDRSLSIKELNSLLHLARTAPKLLTAAAKKELYYRDHKMELQKIRRSAFRW